MRYNRLGRTVLTVSAISLGTEYLLDRPRETAVAVIHAALDQGVNYLDILWAQPEFRDAMGAARQGRRDHVLLTAHLGAARHDGQYDLTRDLQRCAECFLDYLRRCATDYVDVLFLHNCNTAADYAALMQPGGVLDLAHRLQREGRARFIGFSGHNVVTARQAVESGQTATTGPRSGRDRAPRYGLAGHFFVHRRADFLWQGRPAAAPHPDRVSSLASQPRRCLSELYDR